MIVTDKQYYIDNNLLIKLNLMIKRCIQDKPKRDAVLICEGGEGEGKTTMSVGIAYYVSYITGRPFSNKNIFFRADDLLKFAQETEGQIIIYDEPALDMLSNESWKKEQRSMIKLLMMARKKRHFFIFNLTKFYKFPEYVVVDRALGMVHVYSRNEIEAGRFVYIKRKGLEYLYNSYRTSKKRSYKKYAVLRGTFPDVLDKLIDVSLYEKEKDKAIMNIGESTKETRESKMLKHYRRLFASSILLTTEEKAKILKVSTRTIEKWREGIHLDLENGVGEGYVTENEGEKAKVLLNNEVTKVDDAPPIKDTH